MVETSAQNILNKTADSAKKGILALANEAGLGKYLSDLLNLAQEPPGDNPIQAVVKKLLDQVIKALQFLLGDELYDSAVKVIEGWLEKWRGFDNLAGKFLKSLYDYDKLVEALKTELKKPASDDKKKAASGDLEQLEKFLDKQTKWLDTALTWSGRIKNLTKLDEICPPVKAGLVIAYSLMVVYVVYLGADCLDSDNSQINLIPGLRAIVGKAYA